MDRGKTKSPINRSDASFDSSAEPTIASTGAETVPLTFRHHRLESADVSASGRTCVPVCWARLICVAPALLFLQGPFCLRATLKRSQHYRIEWHELQPPASFTVQAAEDGTCLLVDADIGLDGQRRLVELSGGWRAAGQASARLPGTCSSDHALLCASQHLTCTPPIAYA